MRITLNAEKKVTHGLREFEFRDMVKSQHSDLWAMLRENQRFVFTPETPPQKIGEMDVEQPMTQALSLLSSWVAVQRHTPLLVDDRVIQVLTQNEYPGPLPRAFSTDRLVDRLAEVGLIPIDQLLDTTLRLMRWRYRFVVPSADVLKRLLDRYRNNPPGKELREVAIYVQDCMRDPGLSPGLEATVPPVSVASRLHQEWVTAVAQFVMKVWGDADWPDESAQEVTTWAMRQFLPSLPATMPRPLQGIHARVDHRIVLSTALIASSVIESTKRANTGLRCIAEVLGMRETEYYATIAKVITDRG